MRLKDKVAIITGAATGIGRASAYLFAKEGAKVVVADIDDAGGEETVANIKSDGGEALFIHTDVTVAAEVKQLIDKTVDTYGKLDILFNNAGAIPTFASPGPIEDTEESLWDWQHNINLKSAFLGTKYAVPYMKKAGGGVILNTSSMNAVRPRMYSNAFASAKGAVIAFSRSVALELAPDNIRVNTLNPVLTNTRGAMGHGDESPAGDEGGAHDWVKTIPLGRIAQPEDMAYAALYLVSDEASMVTGVSMNVDGGRGI